MTTEEKVEEKRLNFLVVREDWNEYRVIDEGSLVRLKASISDIIDAGKKEGKKREVKFAFNNQFFKEPAADDKGEPSPDIKISPEDVIQELKFEKIHEPLNIYDVPDRFILIVKATLTEFKRTKKFDGAGNRIYHYGLTCAVNIVDYPK